MAGKRNKNGAGIAHESFTRTALEKLSNYTPFILVVVIISAYSVADLRFIHQHPEQFPEWDSAFYMVSALRASEELTKNFNNITDVFYNTLNGVRPPLIVFLLVFYMGLAGSYYEIILFLNMITIGLILYLSYKIGEAVYSKRVGLLCIVFVSFSTTLFVQSMNVVTDLYQTPFVLATVYAIIRSDYFSRRGWSIASGVMAGLAMLAKFTTPEILAGAYIYIIYAVFSKKAANKHNLANMLFSLLAIVIICGSWYLRNFGLVWHNFGLGARMTGQGHFDYLSMGNSMAILDIVVDLLGPVNLALLLCAAYLAFTRSKKNAGNILIYTFILAALVHLAVKIKYPRYLLPVMPLAVIYTIGTLGVYQKIPVKSILYALVIAGLIPLLFIASGTVYVYGFEGPYVKFGRDYGMGDNGVITTAETISRIYKPGVKVLKLITRNDFSGSALEYQSYIRGADIRVSVPYWAVQANAPYTVGNTYTSDIDRADVIVKGPWDNSSCTDLYTNYDDCMSVLTGLEIAFNKSESDFQLEREFNTDYTVIQIYRRKNQ
jgi:hypothetical protein